VQAALFAGFLSAFLIELLRRLEQDPMGIIQDLLIYQTQMMRNSSLGPYVPPDFSPPEYIVVVNALFYASLGVMLLAAFIAMLIKSWVREFDRGLRAMSIPEQRAKTREFRYLGMEHWKLPEMVAILPLLIQISLFLFAIGLVLFLFHISTPSFGVITAIFGVGVLYYAITTSISLFVTSSPFHSPFSRTLATVYYHAHAHFCPGINYFLSRSMDTTPANALGRAWRDIKIFLQKSLPYLESNFVEPIAASTMDEVQLSMAASALQRIHESAPNSQHSEVLQWSVWQVAGGATLRIPPLFTLPSWILDRGNDVEYFSRLPQAMVVALVAVSLRGPRKWDVERIMAVRAVLQRVGNPKVPWAQLVIAVFDHLLLLNMWVPRYIENMIQAESIDLTSMIRRNELHREEYLSLLSMMSELRSEGWLSREFLIGICLEMLLGQAPNWNCINPPDIVLLDAVVTLAAISCSPDEANRLNILTSGREHPWLLLNIRNPALFARWFEDTPPDYHKNFISLLFLVLYALIHRQSYPLAVQYFTIITAKADEALYTSALTAIASSMSEDGLSAIGRMLVEPQAQELTSVIYDSTFYKEPTVQGELFKSFDHQLGASENPNPNIFAILLILSKHLPSYTTQRLQNRDLELRNPWLRLAARVAAQLDITDGSGVQIGLIYDHRVHNMIAALSLLRYIEGKVTHYTESLLLASFLESREPAISSVALEYYMKTTISYSDPSSPSCSFSAAVSAAFNFITPDHQIWMGYRTLDIFVDGFETLSVEWRRAFAEGFFTLSRRPLPRPRGGTESSTRENELQKILTWEYFNEEGQEREWTDSDFSGLDWMAMAWSLHLSQQSGRGVGGPSQEEVQSWGSSATPVTEEFFLQALCKLLEAAPYYRIVPIIPKLCELVQWFDGTGLHEYHSRISAWMKEASHRHKDFQMHHKFHKSHCTWNI
jgi:hypothetical protein